MTEEQKAKKALTNKLWRQNNPEKVAEYRKKHRKADRDRQTAKRRANGMLPRGNNLTEEERRERYLACKRRYNDKVRQTNSEKKLLRKAKDAERYQLKKAQSNAEPKKMGRPKRGEAIVVTPSRSNGAEYRPFTANEQRMIAEFLASRSA